MTHPGGRALLLIRIQGLLTELSAARETLGVRSADPDDQAVLDALMDRLDVILEEINAVQ